jgi:hypothetical protein
LTPPIVSYTEFRVVLYAIVCVCAPIAAAAAQSQRAGNADPQSIHGSWRVALGRRAPWLERKDPLPDTTEWLGKGVKFAGKRVSGPTLLTCADAGYETVDFPADALFQGGLPAPPERAARALGIKHFPVPSVELNCETGLFDFHLVAKDTMLVAVNNVIWTMVRVPGDARPRPRERGNR